MKNKDKKRIKWINLLILILPILISFLFIITPFEKQRLIYANTTINYKESASQIDSFNYSYDYFKNSDIITLENNIFSIQTDELKNPSVIRTIFNNLFNVIGLGWHDVCYHNFDAKLYICKIPTTLESPTIFTIYETSMNGKSERDIYVYPRKEKCELHNTKKGINLRINNKIRYPPDDMVVEYLKSNPIKDCPELQVKGWNEITAEIYVRPNFWIVLAKNLLLLLAWAGILFLLIEIRKFTYN
nr:hypothetical protein [Candidatus Woesearchaeota archaeon]